ncbi:SYNTAXIN like protein [Tubulinosema ratisbonensis]|uniref:SYNTAXIN like protein n=1 Tax=Tubulinosema ratisbonensis TaxID=291195 RepID=A0A437ALR2_9MICR|nr:SYNTAXIN like protein [Tubulinosema ratisbonensis]
MDRTNEYSKLIEYSLLTQKKPIYQPNKNIFLEIESIISFLDKQTNLDKFVIEQKIKKIKNLISLLNHQSQPQNENEKLHFKNLKEITDTKIKKYFIVLNKLSKKSNQALIEEKKRRENFVVNLEQEQVLENKSVQEDDVLKKRMISQLNELGQIVSDISLHVSLQGEEIRRIDEVVDESGNFIKEAHYEISRTWDRISDQRKRIIKFFSFWFLLAFIFWLWRKK